MADLFTRALDLSPEERDPFLERECRGDSELLSEVRSLLEKDTRESLLKTKKIEPPSASGATDRIGSYQILEKLGEGGMGMVYLAIDTDLQRRVALKILPDHLSLDREARARFRREARNAAALNHPNVCTVYQIGEVAEDVFVPLVSESLLRRGTPFIAMELIEGANLHDIVKTQGPLEARALIDAAFQIAEGLAEAHRHGVVHRDLKPQNIMLTRSGRIKILDFGLAKALAEQGGVAGLGDPTLITGKGVVFGTPAYMSPEQVRGEPLDAASDVFSLGLVLTELATGCVPFKGKSPVSVMAKILESAPEPLGLDSGLPASFLALRDKCLQKVPADRFRDGGELLEALSEIRNEWRSGRRGSGTTFRLPARAIASLFLIVVLTASGFLLIRGLTHTPTHPPTSGPVLAVMPFRHVGPDDVQYLAQGITEEITGKLTKLRGLSVIASTSALAYKDSDKEPSEIAAELDADYLLEGVVQWVGKEGDSKEVKVTSRLIRKGENTYFWTDSFSEEVAELFAVESEVAQRVIRELDIALLKPERERLGRRPTDKADAYELYLLGCDQASRNYEKGSARAAVDFFSKAVESDPEFALAHARLSMAHSWMYWAGFDVSEGRVVLARRAAERAAALEPDLPEAQLAIGYYYYRCARDYGRATEVFDGLLEEAPNNSDLLMAVAAVDRRQGNFQDAITNFDRAARLDPRSSLKAWEVGETLRFVRRFEEASDWYDRALTESPEFIQGYVSKAELHLLGLGDVEGARRILSAIEGGPGEKGDVSWILTTCSIFEGELDKALRGLQKQDFRHPAPYFLFQLWIQYLIGRDRGPGGWDPMKAVAESLRVTLEVELAADPDAPNLHSLLGLAHAGLLDGEQAKKEGRRGVQLAKAANDALLEAEMSFQLAWIHWMLGEIEESIALLEELLASPSWVTVDRLRIDPTFGNGKDDSRWQALLNPLSGA